MLLDKSPPGEIAATAQTMSSTPLRRKIYLLLDGLDETQGLFTGQDVLSVALNLFEGLEAQVSVRLWVSSQDNIDLSKRLRECAVINLDDQAESDVRDHLAREVPKIMDPGSDFAALEVCGKPCEWPNSQTSLLQARQATNEHSKKWSHGS